MEPQDERTQGGGGTVTIFLVVVACLALWLSLVALWKVAEAREDISNLWRAYTRHEHSVDAHDLPTNGFLIGNMKRADVARETELYALAEALGYTIEPRRLEECSAVARKAKK